MSIACTGTGANGDHCCYIAGEVCEFLFTDRGGTPRCGIWNNMDSEEWKIAPVGLYFVNNYPGQNCKDWPQKIPEVMAKTDTTGPFGLCCWGRGNA